MKVAVAMSGGVDSSVAAALMVDKYGKNNVFGVTMKLFCYGEEGGGDKSCCSLDAISDAATVCSQLGIPHYVVNLEKEFEKDVINDFVKSYQDGKTPNPCIRCNQLIKYEYLLNKVVGLGANILVTGHYARVSKNSHGHNLLKGLDESKDQSYFLYNLTQDQLAMVEFPIGELKKTETRKLAKKLGLKTAEKTESQDICFVGTTTADFLKDRVVAAPGNIVNSVGNILGRHNGLAYYTIGQRKGLGGGFSEKTYVVGIDKLKNEVIVGPESELFGNELTVSNPHWVNEPPRFPLKCQAKIRYQAEAADCIINRHPELDSGSIKITFSNPQKAVTPGQSVVFYHGDQVLGGGIITN